VRHGEGCPHATGKGSGKGVVNFRIFGVKMTMTYFGAFWHYF